MDAATALSYVALGGLLGMVGQGARVIVGIKKQFDQLKASGTPVKPMDSWFDVKQLLISLLMGAVAGAVAAVSADAPTITKQYMMGIMAAGYAGSDFIEGFMSKSLPK